MKRVKTGLHSHVIVNNIIFVLFHGYVTLLLSVQNDLDCLDSQENITLLNCISNIRLKRQDEQEVASLLKALMKSMCCRGEISI